ncbi:MAG: PadR family transcriptional regulator [Acidimicrobiia bacterium]
MEATALSVTELGVLGLLAEGPSHGFALSKHFQENGEVGRILKVRRPLVYRALGRLVEAGLAVPMHTEPGVAGPQRVIHRITRTGRSRLRLWLKEPVEHVRSLRIEFLLKLELLRRSGESPRALIDAQRQALTETLQALGAPPSSDHVESWRRHIARAAATFLDELALAWS